MGNTNLIILKIIALGSSKNTNKLSNYNNINSSRYNESLLLVSVLFIRRIIIIIKFGSVLKIWVELREKVQIEQKLN